MEKYGTSGQARDYNIIRRMLFACWITKATTTQSEYVICIAFRGKNTSSDAKTPQCYVISILSLLLLLTVTRTRRIS